MAYEHANLAQTNITEKLIENLRNNLFDAVYFGNKAEARQYICDQISPDMKVAFGGSMTVRMLDIRSYAHSIGAQVLDHSIPGLSESHRLDIMRKQLTSDLFISSSNAITSSGFLVNVDGNGNRVSSMIFGPRKVIIVAGINKIVHSVNEAFKRIEFVAAPMNMKRLERSTPCSIEGVCVDCDSNERGCRAFSIIKRRPALTPTEIILVGEMLGM